MDGTQAMGSAIRPLADCPQFLPQVAQWIYEQWWTEVAGASPAVLAAMLRENLSRAPLPQTLVACEGAKVVGTVSVLAHDVGTERWPEMTPWLAALYVAPAARRRGIGSALIEAARAQAARTGSGPLYLVTTGQQGYYERRGWQVLEHHPDAVLMARTADTVRTPR